MRQYHVGELVVVDLVEGKRVPVGIVTDRDMVIEIIGDSLSVDDFTAADSHRNSLVVISDIHLSNTTP